MDAHGQISGIGGAADKTSSVQNISTDAATSAQKLEEQLKLLTTVKWQGKLIEHLPDFLIKFCIDITLKNVSLPKKENKAENWEFNLKIDKINDVIKANQLGVKTLEILKNSTAMRFADVMTEQAKTTDGLVAAKTQLSEKDQQLDALTQKHASSEKQTQTLTEQLAKKSEGFAEMKQDHQKNLAKIQEQLETKTLEAAQLQKQNTSTKTTNKELIKNLEKALDQLDKKKMQLDQLTNELAEVRVQLAQSKDQLKQFHEMGEGISQHKREVFDKLVEGLEDNQASAAVISDILSERTTKETDAFIQEVEGNTAKFKEQAAAAKKRLETILKAAPKKAKPDDTSTHQL